MRSEPTSATFGACFTRPTTYVAIAPPPCTSVLPNTAPGSKNLSSAADPAALRVIVGSFGRATRLAAPPTPRTIAVSIDGSLLKSAPRSRKIDETDGTGGFSIRCVADAGAADAAAPLAGAADCARADETE